jgi:hypothetical protein
LLSLREEATPGEYATKMGLQLDNMPFCEAETSFLGCECLMGEILTAEGLQFDDVILDLK